MALFKQAIQLGRTVDLIYFNRDDAYLDELIQASEAI